MVSRESVIDALRLVNDPELHKSLVELDMVRDVTVRGGEVQVTVALTVAGCPLRNTIENDVRAAVQALPGVERVEVNLTTMTDEERRDLSRRLRGDQAGASPILSADSKTETIAVASGKGGVGKSTVTVNLAAAMAASGLRVGVVDADVHGFSVPGLLGITAPPTRVDEMILPPVAHGIKTISIGMLLDRNQPVAWRGPMLHRALEQFLTDVYFGDLDVLLLDLPPGTGDIAISVGQLLPGSEILVVTTPQAAAAEVAERAGTVAAQTGQKVSGVIENMSWLTLPGGERMELFGSGGGTLVSERLGEALGYSVPLLGSIPLDVRLREGGDAGEPVVLDESAEEAESAGGELRRIAAALAGRPRGLAGLNLGVTPRS